MHNEEKCKAYGNTNNDSFCMQFNKYMSCAWLPCMACCYLTEVAEALYVLKWGPYPGQAYNIERWGHSAAYFLSMDLARYL